MALLRLGRLHQRLRAIPGILAGNDPVGDQVVFNWESEKHAPEQKVVRGTFTRTGGTGKYAGIRGSGTYVDYSGEFRALTEGEIVSYLTFEGNYKGGEHEAICNHSGDLRGIEHRKTVRLEQLVAAEPISVCNIDGNSSGCRTLTAYDDSFFSRSVPGQSSGSRLLGRGSCVIEAFVNELQLMYERTDTTLEPSYPGIISFVAQLALETIATSDAAYHDINHTIMVTLVG